MRQARVSVVMPAFNESDGIVEFLTELKAALCNVELSFVVVDDFSSDDTAGGVELWAGLTRSKVTVIRNSHNEGHGASTVTALSQGLTVGADVIVAIDGDGQFFGVDVARVVEALLTEGVDVVEGCRQERGDPLFRRLASAATRTLVFARCGTRPRDANTPLRAYRPEILRRLLASLPADVITPNLLISSMVRHAKLGVAEVEVTSRPRRGSEAAGSTWNSRRRSVPSRRFVYFCADAVVQWFSVEPSSFSGARSLDLAAQDLPVPSLPCYAGLHTSAAADV